jgi:GntR family transcriptional repressor for pyruvate dehydrogenase complex
VAVGTNGKIISPFFDGLEPTLSHPIVVGMTNSNDRAGAEPTTDGLTRLLQALPQTVFHYFEFRRLMAGSAAALAAERATEKDLAHLKARFEALEKAHDGDDPEVETLADADFHLAIYEAAHNLVMTQVMFRVFGMWKGGAFYDRADLYPRKGVRDSFCRQHQAIWQAIAAGNPAAARSAAEAHIRSVEEALREARYADARREIASRRRAGSDLTKRPRASADRSSASGQ